MQFGHWTVIKYHYRKSLARCVCGVERLVATNNLRGGQSKSCGCQNPPRRENGFAKAGLGQGKHPLYNTWISMRRRCLNPKADQYARYGGRGIGICDRWLNGENGMTGLQCFVADVGSRPPGMTLDRIDNDGHYEPSNVRWATQKMQCRHLVGVSPKSAFRAQTEQPRAAGRLRHA